MVIEISKRKEKDLVSCKELISLSTMNILNINTFFIQLIIASFSSVQSLSRVRLMRPHELQAHQAYQLLESTQTHVHRVGDAIQPSHPLSSPSSPALNLSQHQGLFH